jgi:hypothetical protein
MKRQELLHYYAKRFLYVTKVNLTFSSSIHQLVSLQFLLKMGVLHGFMVAFQEMFDAAFVTGVGNKSSGISND